MKLAGKQKGGVCRYRQLEVGLKWFACNFQLQKGIVAFTDRSGRLRLVIWYPRYTKYIYVFICTPHRSEWESDIIFGSTYK